MKMNLTNKTIFEGDGNENELKLKELWGMVNVLPTKLSGGVAP